ncbi:MAG: hypothetical protein AAF702_43655 [Chloroflexota bacterium]
MIATQELTIEDASTIANEYISNIFDESFFITLGKKIDEGWYFTVKCRREDMNRTPAIGGVIVLECGDIQKLSEDRIRDMKEAAETQAAMHKKELPIDKEGHVLRYYARIKATHWLANHVDHKIGATGGFFVPIHSPIWRFSVIDNALKSDDIQLGVIDIDAETGEVRKPNDEEVEIIIRGACASRRYPQYTTAR